VRHGIIRAHDGRNFMPNAAQQAVTNATRLSEIGFPEFTASLITSTFNAITTSYIDQMAQYMALLQVASQTLSEYIKNTVDDISIDEIGAFLVALGAVNDNALNVLLGDSTATASLTDGEATALTTALAPTSGSGGTALALGSGTTIALTAAKQDLITGAIARRIANNKYDLLQTMVRQGVLRLYVDNGTIETRLTFSTYGQSSVSSASTFRQRAEDFTSKSSGIAGGFGVLGGIAAAGVAAGAASASGDTKLTVSTTKDSQRDVSGSRVQIFGRVKLNFKTDFMPLAAPRV
jgi:hypothetical protein